MRVIKFRAWTGKKMIYQEKQYLASFIRRIVPEIIGDHGGGDYREHESYLPNGGVIDEYLLQFTEMQDSHGREIYDGDIVEIRQPYETIQAQVFWGEVTNAYQWICGQTWLFRFKSGAQGPVLPYLRYGYELRVIGNIYEDPELLQK